jgi:DNA-directed RNA polymerase omega subunit
MVDFDLDNCLRFVENKYELVLLAKNRAMEILGGSSQQLIQKSPHEKAFFTALKEIESGAHNYSDLNDKLMTSIKNDITGVMIQTSDLKSSNTNGEELLDQIFQDIKKNSESDEHTFQDIAGVSEDELNLTFERNVVIEEDFNEEEDEI